MQVGVVLAEPANQTRPVLGLAANASYIAAVPVAGKAGAASAPDTCVTSDIDLTRARVRWAGNEHDLSSVAGLPVRFLFRMSGVSLFAFWVSASEAGCSSGYLGASGRDMQC